MPTNLIAWAVLAAVLLLFPPIMSALLIVTAFTGRVVYTYAAFQAFAPEVGLSMMEAATLAVNDTIELFSK